MYVASLIARYSASIIDWAILSCLLDSTLPSLHLGLLESPLETSNLSLHIVHSFHLLRVSFRKTYPETATCL